MSSVMPSEFVEPRNYQLTEAETARMVDLINSGHYQRIVMEFHIKKKTGPVDMIVEN